MTSVDIKQRKRNMQSAFLEDGRAKLSVKLNADEMTWLNKQSSEHGISLAEVVRRALRNAMGRRP